MNLKKISIKPYKHITISGMSTSSYITKFGTLTFKEKVEDAYFWEPSFQWESDFYKETLELPC